MFFPSLILTNSGRALIVKALNGTAINFTKFALGDGAAPEEPRDLKNLVHLAANMQINSIELSANCAVLESTYTNSGLKSKLVAREIGIFANDPDDGEILYAYANAGNEAAVVPPESGDMTVQETFHMVVAVGDAEQVTATLGEYSGYASNILHKDYNLTLIIAQAAAIVSYLPVGFIASKAGRKKTILAGVVMLTTAFTVAAFLNAESPTMLMNAMFALAGIAWATINVNSFPMVVEMCSGGDVGKYTGFYYTASMAAQVATPMLSGLLMDRFGMHVLFPYAAVFTTLAFVTMLFVRHGDSKPQAKIGLEALDEMED